MKLTSTLVERGVPREYHTQDRPDRSRRGGAQARYKVSTREGRLQRFEKFSITTRVTTGPLVGKILVGRMPPGNPTGVRFQASRDNRRQISSRLVTRETHFCRYSRGLTLPPIPSSFRALGRLRDSPRSIPPGMISSWFQARQIQHKIEIYASSLSRCFTLPRPPLWARSVLGKCARGCSGTGRTA